MDENLKLDKDLKDAQVRAEDEQDLVGKEGRATSELRPAGTADIDGKRRDVVTTGEFVEEGDEVRVIEVEGTRIVVDRISNS